MATLCINQRNIFSAKFIKINSHYKKIGCSINVLQQSACLVVNPITLGNCFPLELHAGGLDLRFYDGSDWGLTVGFLLLRYSIVFTVESLSLCYLLFISRFVFTRI